MDVPLETLMTVSLLTPMGDPNSPDCHWGAPAIFWGSPGLGKSDRVRQAAHAIGLDVASLFLSTALPEDLSGVLIPDGKGGAVTHFAHPGINRLLKAKRGVIFTDELTCARPAVQGAGLSLVRDRILANEYLPGGIRIIAAANPPEEAAGGWALTLPMANRLMHFQVPKPNPDEWASWRLNGPTQNAIDVSDMEEQVRQEWSGVFPKYQGLFAGFIKSVGADKLLAIPKDGHPDRGRAWPSPRTWDLATNIAATCEILHRSNEKGKKDQYKALQLSCIEACVGTGPATEWAAWTSAADIPDPKDILMNGWTPDKRRLDICFAAYGQAVAWALAHKDKDEQHEWAIRAWDLLTDAWKKHSMLDVACAGGVPIARAGYITKHCERCRVAAQELLAKLGVQMSFYVNRSGI